MTRKRQGRGAARPTALGLSGGLALLLGTAMAAGALVAQVPDPPGITATGLAAQAGHGQGHRGGHGSAAGTEQGAAPAAPEPAAAPASPEPAASSASPEHAAGTEQDAVPAAVAALPRSEPVAVRVPSIGVASPLHALGLATDGTLQVPTGALVDEAAWYSGSPTPGEPGPSVLEGHVTGPGGRPSVFFELAALEPGDRVEVDRADGGTVVFEVYGVDSYPKARFPTVSVYGPTAGAELRLITCGGDFDDASGHHVDNTVVYARLVDDHA